MIVSRTGTSMTETRSGERPGTAFAANSRMRATRPGACESGVWRRNTAADAGVVFPIARSSFWSTTCTRAVRTPSMRENVSESSCDSA